MQHDFNNLPSLSTEQANVVAAYLTRYGTLAQIAIESGFDFGTFLDHLAAPEVQAHITHARRMARHRMEHYAAEAAHAAIHTLKSITEDLDADKTERRRAASAILRSVGAARRPARKPKPESIDVPRLNKLIDDLEKANHPSTDPPPTDLPTSAPPPSAPPLPPSPRAGRAGEGSALHPTPPPPPSPRAGRAGEGSASPNSAPSPHSDGERLGEGLPNLQRSNTTKPNGDNDYPRAQPKTAHTIPPSANSASPPRPLRCSDSDHPP